MPVWKKLRSTSVPCKKGLGKYRKLWYTEKSIEKRENRLDKMVHLTLV